MSKELYLKIPKKINYFLNQLKDQDPFMYNFMNQVYMTIKKAEIPIEEGVVEGPLPSLSEEDSILLVAEFLELCNPTYKEALLNDYKNSKVIFNPVKESGIRRWAKIGDYQVTINKNNTIIQARELVHEFFHRLNLNNHIMNLVFTETVSITAELMFIDFLRKKGYSEYDLNLTMQGRKQIYANNLRYLKLMLPLYLEQKEKGTIEDDFYNKLIQQEHISPKDLKNNLFFLLETDNHELRIYRQTMGYVLAKTFLSNSPTPEDLAEINELLHNDKITEFQRKIMGNNTIEEVHKFATKEDFTYRPAEFIKR